MLLITVYNSNSLWTYHIQNPKIKIGKKKFNLKSSPFYNTHFLHFLLGLTVRTTCSPRQLLPYPSSKQWQTLVSHYKASLWLWRQRSKQTAENKSRCWCLTASIIAVLGDLGSVSGWKNLWDMCWGCWMVFDISQCCLGSESGRPES